MSFLDDMFDAQFPPIEKKAWMENVEFVLVRDEETLERCVQECIDSGVYGLDTETTGLDSRVFDGMVNNKIVGFCLAPTPFKGYYIPIRHKKGFNFSISKLKEPLLRLFSSKAVAVFHNAKFDLEVMEFDPSVKWGDWDDVKKWDDTMILAYLDDPIRHKRKRIGLKPLSKECLNREQIELLELFPKGTKNLDFSTLDSEWEPVLWYAAGDAICTLMLRHYFYDSIVNPTDPERNQKLIYFVEKGCTLATRWMERCRIYIDLEKTKELIILGQQEFLDAFYDVYREVNKALGRNVIPPALRQFRKKVIVDDPDNDIFTQLEILQKQVSRSSIKSDDVVEKNGKEFPRHYYITSAQQLGQLFDELEVPDLKRTEKSGQVATGKDILDQIVEKHGESYEFMKKIKKFREVQKALSTYLYPIYEDTDRTDSTLWANFNAYKTDTGRFATPVDKNRARFGGAHLNVQSTPKGGMGSKDKRPECMKRLRECYSCPEGWVFAGIDFSGVELRIVTNMSLEQKWIDAFFRCSTCGENFPKDKNPPQFCPSCHSDKVGDLHSLTAIQFFGPAVVNQADFKKIRNNIKGVNFGFIYGGSYKAVVRALACSDNKAKQFKDKFDVGFPGLKKWWDILIAYARKKGFVKTAFDRVYPLPDIQSPEFGFRAKAERNAKNAPIQGCLHPDSMVLTNKGYWKILDLYERGSVDDLHFWSGTSWEKGRVLYSGEKKVSKTIFSSGNFIKTSPDHLFLTYEEGSLKWVRQENLKKGSWVLTSNKQVEITEPFYDYQTERRVQTSHRFSTGSTPHNYKNFNIQGNSETLWEFLGLLYGDGSLREDYFVLHIGGDHAFSFAQSYMEKLNRDLDLGAIIRETTPEEGKKARWKLKVHTKSFRIFCRDVLGVKTQNTYTKRFPKAVWSESLQNRRAFLRGYFSADGTVSNNLETVSVRSVNEGLLRDTHLLLRSLGLRSTVSFHSQRVRVQDKIRFRDEIGFCVEHKRKRLASYKENPLSYSSWKLPPEIVKKVGLLVKQSQSYDCFSAGEKAAVRRLTVGSGSKYQCQKYLQKINPSEIPKDLENLFLYDYEQVSCKQVSEDLIEMYDMEIFSEDHTFVCDGFCVHNSSADITKSSMYAIYLECKKRGWMDLLKMEITMHDELCFIIHKSIFREAMEMLSFQMTENKFIRRLFEHKGWVIPLAVDIEVGTDWTVPYNLLELMVQHKGDLEAWPDLLKPLYPDYAYEGKEPQVQPDAEYVIKSPRDVRTLKALLFVYKRTIHSEGGLLRLKNEKGETLRDCQVDIEEFVKMAKELGL